MGGVAWRDSVRGTPAAGRAPAPQGRDGRNQTGRRDRKCRLHGAARQHEIVCVQAVFYACPASDHTAMGRRGTLARIGTLRAPHPPAHFAHSFILLVSLALYARARVHARGRAPRVPRHGDGWPSAFARQTSADSASWSPEASVADSLPFVAPSAVRLAAVPARSSRNDAESVAHFAPRTRSGLDLPCSRPSSRAASCTRP